MDNNISTGGERFDPEFDNVEEMVAAPGASEQDQAMREFADEQAARDKEFEDGVPAPQEEEPFGGFEEEAPQEEPDTHPMQEQPEPVEERPEPTNSQEQPAKEADRLDLTNPFFMTVYATDKRTYVEYYQGENAQEEAEHYAEAKATQSGHAVAIFGPQRAVYALPQEVKAKPMELGF